MKVFERGDIVIPCSVVVFNFKLSDTILLQECTKFKSDIDYPTFKNLKVLLLDLEWASGSFLKIEMRKREFNDDDS